MKKLVLIAVLVMLVFAMVVPVASAAPPAAPSAAGGYWYRVNYGDTLYGISWYTGVPVQNIANANGISNVNWIYAGQYLWIPTVAPVPSGTYHTVQWGETLYSISVAYGVNMWTIAQANGIYNLNWIYAGQVLYIP